MSGLVPKLPCHVDIIVPGLFRGFSDNACHHFRHIDFPQPLEIHHQNFGLGRKGWVVKKYLSMHRHVVRIGETKVALRLALVMEWLRGIKSFDGSSIRRFCSVQSACLAQESNQQSRPSLKLGTSRYIDEPCDALGAI